MITHFILNYQYSEISKFHLCIQRKDLTVRQNLIKNKRMVLLLSPLLQIKTEF